MQSTEINTYIKQTLLRAAMLPIIYFFIGTFLISLFYVDLFFPLTSWKHLFFITNKTGNIFIAIAAVTFIYKCAVLLCRRFEKKLAERHPVASIIISSIRQGFRILYLLIAINVILTFSVPTKFYATLADNIIKSIIIASIGWISIQIFYTFEAALFQHMNRLSRHEHLRVKALYTKMHILRNMATIVIIIITTATILMTFSSVRNIGISLLASAGFLTAIAGLAAQKTLFSLFSGLQIALSQPIKIGDIVKIENVSGTIEEITFTYVILKLGDNRRFIVPINYFIEKTFENWSRDEDCLKSSLSFHVDYMLPLEPLRTELTRVLKDSTCWDGVANKLQVANLTDKSVEIRIQLSATNSDDLSDLRAHVREKMLDFIRNNYPDHLPKVRLGQLPSPIREVQ